MLSRRSSCFVSRRPVPLHAGVHCGPRPFPHIRPPGCKTLSAVLSSFRREAACFRLLRSRGHRWFPAHHRPMSKMRSGVAPGHRVPRRARWWRRVLAMPKGLQCVALPADSESPTPRVSVPSHPSGRCVPAPPDTAGRTRGKTAAVEPYPMPVWRSQTRPPMPR